MKYNKALFHMQLLYEKLVACATSFSYNLLETLAPIFSLKSYSPLIHLSRQQSPLFPLRLMLSSPLSFLLPCPRFLEC